MDTRTVRRAAVKRPEDGSPLGRSLRRRLGQKSDNGPVFRDVDREPTLAKTLHLAANALLESVGDGGKPLIEKRRVRLVHRCHTS